MTGKKTEPGRVIYKGSVPDTDPITGAGGFWETSIF